MSIAPFSMRPASPESERRRARLVVAIAAVGIAATLLAYAISPGVRHAVSHAEHSVRHAVSRVLDRDQKAHVRARPPTRPAPAPATSTTRRPRVQGAAPQGQAKAAGG